MQKGQKRFLKASLGKTHFKLLFPSFIAFAQKKSLYSILLVFSLAITVLLFFSNGSTAWAPDLVHQARERPG